MWIAALTDRTVIRVEGEDSADFLQGLISNDVKKATSTQSLYSALLTPQGKFLFDFFLIAHEGSFLLDAHQQHATALMEKLSRFKLRSRVTLAATDWKLHAAWGENAPLPAPGDTEYSNGIIRLRDPRYAEMGLRLLSKHAVNDATLMQVDEKEYELHRLDHGIPDGMKDMLQEKDILLELGFEELHGVDFAKGCYMGQELTARTKYRALLKKHFYIVSATDGKTPLPASLTPILGGQMQVGELRSSHGHIGLAMLRDSELQQSTQLEVGGISLTARPPAWRHPLQ